LLTSIQKYSIIKAVIKRAWRQISVMKSSSIPDDFLLHFLRIRCEIKQIIMDLKGVGDEAGCEIFER